MKKFSDKEYQIYENLAQAKSILRKNNGSIEDDEFLQIADATNKDGWTGLLTRLVYKDNIDVEEVLGVYPDLKKSKLDLGKLNKMSYDDIVDSLYDDANSDSDGIIFIGRSENYLIFHVKTFEDGLKICSPSWCLKTKSHWDDYTSNGYQFVIIDEQYVNKRGKTKLLTPNSKGFFGSYSNQKKPEIRYGISIKSRGSIKVFNDNNKSISPRNIPQGILKEINFYLNSGDKDIFKASFDEHDAFDNVRELMEYFIDNHSMIYSSWDCSVHSTSNDDYDDMFDEFIQFAAESNINMYEFYREYRTQIIDDNWFTHCCGAVDYILYRLSGNKGHDDGGIPLSGLFLNEREQSDYSYKYIYGFAQNKYGKMYILQSFDTISEWYKEMLIDFGRVFLMDEMSYKGGMEYDTSEIFTWLKHWITTEENEYFWKFIEIFFHLNIHVNDKYCSRIFFINEFIETIKNWVSLKVRLIIDYDPGDDFAERVFADNSINKTLIISEMVEMSEYTSVSRITDFVNALGGESIFMEYAYMESGTDELTKEAVINFFKTALDIELDGSGKYETSTVTLEQNNLQSEKSDDYMVIKFHYNLLN